MLTGPLERLSLDRFQNPLPLDQSILVGMAASDFAGGADAGVFRPVLRRLHAPGHAVGVGCRTDSESPSAANSALTRRSWHDETLAKASTGSGHLIKVDEAVRAMAE